MHEVDPEIGDAEGVHAGVGGAIGEAEAGEGRDDDVEGIGGIAAMGGGVGEEGDDVEEFEEGTGPAVSEDEREGRGPLAFGVEEVDVAGGGVELVVGEGREAIDLGLPVEAIVPVGAEICEECGVEAVGVGRGGDLVGPAGAFEAGVEIVHGRGGVGDRESVDEGQGSASECMMKPRNFSIQLFMRGG